MHVEVNTDNHIQGSEELKRTVTLEIESSIERFGARVTRVEVHLSDESSSKKSGDDDKRCLIEARLAGLQPITVSANASSVEQAVVAAADKLRKTLDRTLGRLDDPKGRVSFSGDSN